MNQSNSFPLINALRTTADPISTSTAESAGLFKKILKQYQSALMPQTSDTKKQLVHDTTPLRNIGTAKTSTKIDDAEEGMTVSNTRISDGTLSDAIRDSASKYGVPQKMIEAVVCVESGGKCNAVSSAGAMGVMQLMPATAKELGVKNPFDVSENVDAGTRYLKQLYDRYDGNWQNALAAYNAGMGNVDKHKGIPPFKETIAYVKNVFNRFLSRS